MQQVPPKIVLRGDTELAKAFIGKANSVMKSLEESMSYRDLKQDHRYFEPFPGALIKCSVVFGLRTILIIIPTQAGKAFKEGLECFCNCNFTVGKVIEQTGTLDDRTGYGEIFLYTVLACYKKRQYKLYENCLASDFAEYIVGQKVILIPYNEASFTCCTIPVGSTACSPIVSELDISHDDWRTTYRILPWNGIRLKKWINL